MLSCRLGSWRDSFKFSFRSTFQFGPTHSVAMTSRRRCGWRDFYFAHRLVCWWATPCVRRSRHMALTGVFLCTYKQHVSFPQSSQYYWRLKGTLILKELYSLASLNSRWRSHHKAALKNWFKLASPISILGLVRLKTLKPLRIVCDRRGKRLLLREFASFWERRCSSIWHLPCPRCTISQRESSIGSLTTSRLCWVSKQMKCSTSMPSPACQRHF